VKARETSLKYIVAGQPIYLSGPPRPQTVIASSNQFEVTPPVLLLIALALAAGAGRSLIAWLMVLGICRNALRPCRHFRHVEQQSNSAARAWFAGVCVFAMWTTSALKLLLRSRRLVLLLPAARLPHPSLIDNYRQAQKRFPRPAAKALKEWGTAHR